MFAIFILFILRILYVNCDLKIIDPIFPQFTNIDYNMTRMISTASPYNIEEICEPLKAWCLTRHGNDYPSNDDLNGIREKLVPDIQQLILSVYAQESDNNFSKLEDYQKQTIRRIKGWKNVLASGKHKEINEHGKSIMENLGRRWNAKLKKLTKHLEEHEIEVLSSKEKRCVISGKKFLKTFYEKDSDDIDVQKASLEDKRIKLVKPEKKLVRVEDPQKSEQLISVADLHFRNNSSSIIKRIQELLFPDHVDNYQEHRERITEEIVQIMYSACTNSFYFVEENGTKADAWCNLFTFEDFEIFEEMQDLKYYYQDGYHIDYNLTLGDAITIDLNKFIRESDGLKFKLFIGHSINILSVITRFNLFRDEVKLTLDNIKDFKNRKWKTSFMIPFGCNIMVVVSNCGFETSRVSFYLNEIPLTMVMDDGNTCTKCPTDKFLKMLDGFNMKEPDSHSNTIRESNLEHQKNKESKKENNEK